MVTAEKKIKVTKDIVGKYVAVKFTDVGRVSGICVEFREDDRKQLQVFCPSSGSLMWVENDQIVEIGQHVDMTRAV